MLLIPPNVHFRKLNLSIVCALEFFKNVEEDIHLEVIIVTLPVQGVGSSPDLSLTEGTTFHCLIIDWVMEQAYDDGPNTKKWLFQV